MKIFLISILTLSFLTVSNNLFAQENIDGVLKTKSSKETQTKKRRRRKKVMMCHECGKPEIECECEGEGHGVHHDEEKEGHHNH